MELERVLADVTLTKIEFLATYRLGNAAALTTFYTCDGLIIPPNSDLIKGKHAIHSFWQSLIDMGIEAINMKTIEMEVIQDTVIEVSRFDLIGTGFSILDKGNHLAIWKRVAGLWKINKDIFNSNRPAQ